MISSSQKSFFTSKDHETEFVKENKQTFIVHSNENPLIINFPSATNTNLKYGVKKFFEIEEFYYHVDPLNIAGYRTDYKDISNLVIDKIGVTPTYYYEGNIPFDGRLVEKIMAAYAKTPMEIIGYNTGDIYDEHGEQLSIAQLVYPKSEANGGVTYFSKDRPDAPLEIKQPLGQANLTLTFQWPYKLSVIDEMTDSIHDHQVPFTENNEDLKCVFYKGHPKSRGYTIKFSVYDVSANL